MERDGKTLSIAVGDASNQTVVQRKLRMLALIRRVPSYVLKTVVLVMTAFSACPFSVNASSVEFGEATRRNMTNDSPPDRCSKPLDPLVLTFGEGDAVCNAYLEQLRSGPLAAAAECEFLAKSRATSVVPLDLGTSYYEELTDALLDKLVEFLWQRDANPAWYFGTYEFVSWRNEPSQREEAIRIFRLQVEERLNRASRLALIDIDNDGQGEWVLYVAQLICSTGQPAMPVVLTDDKQNIDIAKTGLLTQHPTRYDGSWYAARAGDAPLDGASMIAAEDAFVAARYVFFKYAGTTYLSLGWVSPVQRVNPGLSWNERKVFLVKEGKSAEVCVVRSIPATARD
jgi:hypothetical protein